MQHPVVSLCPALLCNTLRPGKLKNPMTITVMQAQGLEGFPISQEVPCLCLESRRDQGASMAILVHILPCEQIIRCPGTGAWDLVINLGVIHTPLADAGSDLVGSVTPGRWLFI